MPLGSNYLGSAYLGEGYVSGVMPTSASLAASFAASITASITDIPLSTTVDATFVAQYSPEGVGVPATLSATAGISGTLVGIISTSGGTVVATFTGSSASGTPVVHLFSTQPGNQFVTDITSYGLHANVRVYVTVGIPTASLGNDGDYALRRDSTNGSGVQMYRRASGAWAAIA